MVDEVMTIPEVADHLKVTRQTIHKLMKEGKIKAFKIGRSIRILRSEIERFIQKQIKQVRETTMKFDWGGARVEHNDVPKLKKKVLTTITETLKKLSPAGQELPLRCEGLTGWELYRVPSFPYQHIFAKGVFCGSKGRSKLYALIDDTIIEIEDFSFSGTPDAFYVEVKGSTACMSELEFLAFIPWEEYYH